MTLGQYSACVTFQPSAWPNFYFKSGVAFTNLNWQSRGGLAVDVLNTNTAPITVSIRVDDDFSANGVQHCQTASLSFPASASGTIVMAFPQSAITGMSAGPPLVASNALNTSACGPALNWSNIVAFQIFLNSPTNPTTLFIDNLRLPAVPDLDEIVDAYGQYTGTDWPGKIHQDTDFADQNTQEQQWCAAHPRPANRDVYGAWQDGPQLAASGFFRTAWVAGTNEVAPGSTDCGRWWLVAPSGRLFFSIGIDVIDYGETTAVSGRENMFTWLPDDDDPLTQFSQPCTNQTANFYGMDLYRKFGTNWMRLAQSRVFDRLDAWGFNSIGNWSSSDLFTGHRVPYTVPIWYDWTGLATFTSAAQTMIDQFDPGFLHSVDAAIASWSAFSNQVVTLPSSWTTACVTDLSAFLTDFAGQYFSVINAKIKLYAPSQLYLGSRFASHPIEAVRAAAQSSDVITFNIYSQSLGTNT